MRTTLISVLRTSYGVSGTGTSRGAGLDGDLAYHTDSIWKCASSYRITVIQKEVKGG